MIHFVHYANLAGTGNRQRDLEIAKIRAHAAKASYRPPRSRRKTRVGNPVFGLALRPNNGHLYDSDSYSFSSDGYYPDIDYLKTNEQDRYLEYCREVILRLVPSLSKQLIPPLFVPGIENEVTAGGLEYLLSFYERDPLDFSATPKPQENVILQQMKQYQDLCHVILAMAIGFRGCDSDAPYPFQEPRIQVHRSMAISLLRRRLILPTATANDGAIMTMLELAQLDMMMGDSKTANVHLKYSEALIASRGGIQGLQANSKVQAFAAQFAVSGALEAIPPFVATGNVGIPVGFQNLAARQTLFPQTLCMIARLAGVRTCFVKDRSHTAAMSRKVLYWPDPFSSVTDHDLDWQRKLAVGCPGACLPDQPDGTPPFERILCLALICHRVNTLRTERPAVVWQLSWAMRLWGDLTRMSVPCDNPKRGALIWAWLTYGVSLAGAAQNPADEALGFLHRLKAHFVLYEWTAPDIESLAGNFFLSPALLNLLHCYWPIALSHR